MATPVFFLQLLYFLTLNAYFWYWAIWWRPFILWRPIYSWLSGRFSSSETYFQNLSWDSILKYPYSMPSWL